MEQQKIIDELAEIQVKIDEYLEILGSEKVLKSVIIKELSEVQKDFGDERRTQIIEDTGEIRLEDLVQMEDVAVTVTRGGYLKRTAVDTYRRQTRGGKGRIGMSTRAEDVVEHLIIASTHAYLLIFTNKGRVYWLKIYNIPDATTVGKGKHASGLMALQPDEIADGVLAGEGVRAGKFIVMVTKQGVIKKCELTEFDNPMSRGIIALGLDEGDPVAWQIWAVGPTGDDTLKPMLTRHPAKSLAVAAFVLAVDDPRRRVLEQLRQPFLPLEQRQRRDVLAIEFDEVEGEVDQAAVSGVGGLLHQLERGHAVGTDAAQLTVDVCRLHWELGEGRGRCRILCRPVESGPGEELNLAAVRCGRPSDSRRI